MIKITGSWVLAYGFAVVMLLSLAEARGQQQATPVGVDEVRFEPMAQTIPVLGRFVAQQSGVVAARAKGPVASLAVNVGDHVGRGDVIAELDQDRLRSQLELQQAELKGLTAALTTAQAKEVYAGKELARIAKLRGSAAFSQYDYDSRLQELEVAKSSRQEAEAGIARGEVDTKLAEIELRDGSIRAPYPGVVTKRHTSEGAWLNVGEPVVTLINDTELEIEADVPSDRLPGVPQGREIEAALDDGTRFTAVVRAVIPDENPAARTRAARLVPRLEQPQSPLAVNQPVTLLLPASNASEVITVDKDAVLRRGQQAIVFIVEEGAASPRPVELGQAVGSRFQVLDGLQAGDVVVIRGNERLRPGQPVMFPGQPPQAGETGGKQG